MNTKTMSTLAVIFCVALTVVSSSSMKRPYEYVSVHDPECAGTGLRSLLGQSQEAFSCKQRFNKATGKTEYPKCRVECGSIAPEDPVVSKRYICKKRKGTWVERSSRSSINCTRPLVSFENELYFLYQGRRRNFEQRPMDTITQTSTASIFPPNAKATVFLLSTFTFSAKLYVLLDDGSLVTYDYETNEFDMTGMTLPTTGDAPVQMLSGIFTEGVYYVYSIGSTIFLKTINLDTFEASDVGSLTDPDGADIKTLNIVDASDKVYFMYTTALRSRVSSFDPEDQSVSHYGYMPAHNGCEIVVAFFGESKALTTCGQLSFPDFETQFNASGTQNASRAISYTVDTLGSDDWSSLIHVGMPLIF